MNRYETNLKNTSPVIDDLKNEYNKMPRGVFDLSHRKVFDISNGSIVPIGVWEMLPNSDLYLQYDVQLLSHNPTLRRLLSGSTVELRTYFRPYNDSWEAWNNFITKGRSGKVSKTIPKLDWLGGTEFNSLNSKYFIYTTPHNPMQRLGILPPLFFGGDTKKAISDPTNSKYNSEQELLFLSKDTSEDLSSLSDFVCGISGIDSFAKLQASTSYQVSSLIAVTYNSIAKEFWDSNLMQDNPYWFPENEFHDCVLPYELDDIAFSSSYDIMKYYCDHKDDADFDMKNAIGNTSFQGLKHALLNRILKADKRGDYFTTGSPFPDLIRGDSPLLSIIGAGVTGDVNSTIDFDKSLSNRDDLLAQWNQTHTFGLETTYDKLYPGVLGLDAQTNLPILDTDSTDNFNTYRNKFKNALNKAEITSTLSNTSVTGLTFSMNQWRALATMTVFMERMARTDGSYNKLIEAQFGHNPKWHSRRPTYCGGSKQSIVFSEVVQTSESASTPLGTTGGRAVSAQQNKEIRVHADDFGCAMTVMVIRPDEYYCQGVDKMWSRLNNAEQYFPILNNLAPDATLNKELYIKGDNSTDEDVFNYQERFAYYKSHKNTVSGLMSLASSTIGSIGEYVMHRLFTNTPNFNDAFQRESEDSNMKSVYTSANESEYVCTIGCNAKFVAPIPEITVPSDMGISY